MERDFGCIVSHTSGDLRTNAKRCLRWGGGACGRGLLPATVPTLRSPSPSSYTVSSNSSAQGRPDSKGRSDSKIQEPNLNQQRISLEAQLLVTSVVLGQNRQQQSEAGASSMVPQRITARGKQALEPLPPPHSLPAAQISQPSQPTRARKKLRRM